MTRDTNNNEYNFEEGEILLFDKPYTWTSFDVVNKVKVFLKYYCHNPKIKVGHAGTLDPLATGLVIVCTGKMTKQIDTLQAMEKEYEGIFYIGATRPSYDKETEIDSNKGCDNITKDFLISVSEKFIGKIEQRPPLYSAIKIDGVRAYRHARDNNKKAARLLKPRNVEIFKFDITNINLPYVSFYIKCSKGTYIRSIARDFGEALGCGAYLEELRRTAIGDFKIENAMDVQKFRDKVLKIK